MDKTYIAIDLKSFYASVECMERGLDPLTTNLVVADETRSEKTICLAVSPSLKSYGVKGRPRLFEVIQKVKEVNTVRKQQLHGYDFKGKSYDNTELVKDPFLAVSYLVAPPRMSHYMEYSAKIYQVYLKYISPEDIHVYSIDEVFIDVTPYLSTYQMSAHELAMTMIRDVLKTTGITATAGIGTNMYLAKIAMDIMAKKMPADKDGVRIAELDEMTYRKNLWEHRPLTSFWRVGSGIAKKLEDIGIYTMGDIAMMSLQQEGEDRLYRLFGVNAELLIDHAWGWEPCTMKEIRSYTPENSSLSSGQVLMEPYPFDKAMLVAKEMADQLGLDLFAKKLVTDQIVLTISFDIESFRHGYQGDVTTDRYGRTIPKSVNGRAHLKTFTSSSNELMKEVDKLFERIVDPDMYIRKITVVASHVITEEEYKKHGTVEQLDLFSNHEVEEEKRKAEEKQSEKEKRSQAAILKIREKYGKNAILKGLNYEEGATGKERNGQIGGHKA